MDVQRDEKGRLLEGSVLNPAGRGSGRMTWQSYADRVAFFRDKSREEIEDIFSAPDFKKRPDRDCGIIKQIIAEMHETLLDREIGKTIGKNEFSGPEGGPVEVKEVDAARKTVTSKLLQGIVLPGDDATDKPAQ